MMATGGASPPFSNPLGCLDREGLFCSVDRCYCALRGQYTVDVVTLMIDMLITIYSIDGIHAAFAETGEKRLNPASANYAANISAPP